MPQTKEYLEYCTNRMWSCLCMLTLLTSLLDSTCEVTRCREIKRDGSHFCPDHTCHERDCEGKCDPKPYCDDREFLHQQSFSFDASWSNSHV